MPDSPVNDPNEPDSSTPPQSTAIGGAGAGTRPSLPPQGAPMMGGAVRAAGAEMRQAEMVKMIITGLEQAWSLTHNRSELGKAIFDVIGKLTKAVGKNEETKGNALEASMRRQMTARPGAQPMTPAQGGAPPQPPPGPIPQMGVAPGGAGP